MPTKPEGPAQEPQVNCTCEHPDLDCEMHPATLVPSKPASLREAVEQLRAIPAAWKERPDPLAELHEIRYGSQPAGAREKNWLVDAVENCPDPVLKQNCKQLLGNDYTNAAVQLIADAQTAAKDALLHHVVMAVCDPREAVNGNLPTPAKAVELIIDRMHAAERERDSLASDLQGANKMIRDYDERLKALKAENAALKAGKEPKR